MKRLFPLLWAAVLAFSLSGCEESDDGRGSGAPSLQAQEALMVKYPGATDISWETRGMYAVADFALAAGPASRTEYSAWFDENGRWYMTETDIRFDELPEAVRTAFRASEYGTWRLDDIDKLEREGAETIYVIEVEGRENGTETEYDLYYAPDGVLTKKVADAGDDDYQNYIPSAPGSGIESYLKANYPDARILEIDHENGMTEVEILDGRTCRELLFDRNANWLYTKTEVRSGDVPAAVMQALRDSQYADYRIDDIDYYQTGSGDYYRFDLESPLGDIKADITPEGTLTVVTPGGDDPSAGGGNGQMLEGSAAEFIASKYPGARVLEYDHDDGLLEVEILHEQREKDVYFNGAGQWVKTEWDILRSELPQAVATVIAQQYAAYRIDDIEFVQTPSGEYYRVELEGGNREITLRIDAGGNIL